MGGSSQKSTSTQNSTSSGTATTTPDVPDFLKNPAVAMAGTLGNLQAQGPAAYTPQTNALQQQGQDATAALTNPAYTGAYKSLDQITQAPDVTGQSVLTGLDSYMSPYLSDVVNSTLADYDAQAGQTTAQQAAAAAANKAFQGSRYGIQEAQTTSDLARGRATTESGLLNQGYTQATTLSGQDADRRQAAALANQQAAENFNQTLLGKSQQQESIRNAIQDNTRANAAAQLGAGQQQFANDAAISQYPLEYQQALEGLFQGLDPSLFTGSTATTNEQQSGTSTGKTSSNAGFLGNLGQIAQIGGTAMAMSDARVKTGVRTVGRDAKGRRWVSFAYLWAPAIRHIGVIAQEIMKTDPDAVHVGPAGVLMVDYGKLS